MPIDSGAELQSHRSIPLLTYGHNNARGISMSANRAGSAHARANASADPEIQKPGLKLRRRSSLVSAHRRLVSGPHVTLEAPTIDDLGVEAPVGSDAESRE